MLHPGGTGSPGGGEHQLARTGKPSNGAGGHEHAHLAWFSISRIGNNLHTPGWGQQPAHLATHRDGVSTVIARTSPQRYLL